MVDRKMINQGIYNTVNFFSTTEKYSHSFNCLEKEYIVGFLIYLYIISIITAQRKRIEQYGLDSDKVASILFVFDDLVGSITSASK